MQLMANGGYYGHTTCHQLAADWHVSWQTVAQDAAEAGRFLRLDPEFRAQKQAELAGWAADLAKRILSQPSKITGLPDWKSALEARRLEGLWSGIADRVVETDNAGNVPKGPVTITVVKSTSVPNSDTKSHASGTPEPPEGQG